MSVAPEFHQCTHRVHLRNLGTTDKKSSHKIRHRKIPREHQGFWGKKLMEAILMRAGSFMAVIILGYVLKKVGFFKEDDFYVMSKITAFPVSNRLVTTTPAGPKKLLVNGMVKLPML